MYQTRMKYLQHRTIAIKNVIKLQSWWRMYLSRSQYINKIIACIKIINWYRNIKLNDPIYQQRLLDAEAERKLRKERKKRRNKTLERFSEFYDKQNKTKCMPCQMFSCSIQ